MWAVLWCLCWNTLNDEGFSLLQKYLFRGCTHLMVRNSSLFGIEWDFLGFNSTAFNKSSFSLDSFVFFVEMDTTLLWLEFNSMIMCWLKHSPQLRILALAKVLFLPCMWFLGLGVLWVLSVSQNYIKKNKNKNSCPCSKTPALIWSFCISRNIRLIRRTFWSASSLPSCLHI